MKNWDIDDLAEMYRDYDLLRKQKLAAPSAYHWLLDEVEDTMKYCYWSMFYKIPKSFLEEITKIFPIDDAR